MHEIQATPQNIFDTDFKLSLKYPNKVKYKELKHKHGALITNLTENVALYLFPSELALLDDSKEKTLYYVQFKEKPFLGRKAITQIKLWSDPVSSYTDSVFKDGMKITAYAFFKILLPKADLILSDTQQTQAGRRFWEKRVKDALTHSLFVYVIDRNLKTKSQITSMEEFDNIKDDLWGDSDSFLAKRIAISHLKLWNT